MRSLSMWRLILFAALLSGAPAVGPGRVGAEPAGTAATDLPGFGPSLCLAGRGLAYLGERNRVLRSTDGGERWTVSFWGRFQRAREFEVEVGCAGRTAWALFVGPGAASSQKPYVVYRTLDAGQRWTAVAEESYIGVVYPAARARRSFGPYPGPFAVAGPTTAIFLGLAAVLGRRGEVLMNGTADSGRTWRQRVVPCLSPLHPVTLHFTSRLRGWVMGTCWGRETVVSTTDGGRSWSRRVLP